MMRIIETSAKPQVPGGSKFIVDSCSFHPGMQVHDYVLDLEEGKLQSWPMVYILNNQEFAYIGQTTNLMQRMRQHGASVDKQGFTRVNIIFNEEFNASVVTDYEARLIGLMHADQKFKLINGNAGQHSSNYFSKPEYDQMFEELWEELRSLELADETIAELESSALFRYSPYKTLSPDQEIAFEKIYQSIATGIETSDPIVIEGMPGTGKTILALYILKRLRDDPVFSNLNVKLMIPVPSLRATMQASVKSVANLSVSDIIGPHDMANSKEMFDIVMVDEAHRLNKAKGITGFYHHYKKSELLGLPRDATQLDWVLKKARLPILFYDSHQVVRPSGISSIDILEVIPDSFRNRIKLENQMRVSGGQRYLDYIQAILNNENPSREEFEDYDFVLHTSFREFLDAFESTLKKHELTRLLAGFAWPWKTKNSKDPSDVDIIIDGIGKRWNSDGVDWVGRGLNNEEVAREVASIHFIQGYDLSNAFVILGPDIFFDRSTGEIAVSKKDYHDRKGKVSTSLAELTQYIRNIYYVLMTRGMYGTHLYACDDALREYLKDYMRTV